MHYPCGFNPGGLARPHEDICGPFESPHYVSGHKSYPECWYRSQCWSYTPSTPPKPIIDICLPPNMRLWHNIIIW